MSKKKCITYLESKTRDKAQSAVAARCLDIITLNDTSIKNLQKLCGAMVYNSVFLIADFDLVDRKIYTLENVCYHVPGLLKLPMHDILENLSDICFEGTSIVDCLRNVLHESLYPEVVDLIKLNTKDTYSALLCMYFRLTEDYVKLNQVVNMWTDSNTHIISLYTYFEREVINNGKEMY